MRTLEVKHHTPEQVAGYVDEAERLLQARGYDDAERIALLPTIVTLLASKSVSVLADQPAIIPGVMGLGERH